MKRPELWLLMLGLVGGCADRPLSIVAGPPADLGARADLAVVHGDGGSDLAVSAPDDLGPVGAPATPWTGEAVAYQIDPMHRGAQLGTLVPPLHRRWATSPASQLSYPLIADGLVFFLAQAPGGDVGLSALDAQSGTTVWGPIAVGPRFGGGALAYADGRVFTVSVSGPVAALDAATGVQIWAAMTGPYASPPSAAAGAVYLTYENSVIALDAASGTPRWTQPVLAGGGSSPIVSDAAVFLPFICGQAWAFAPGSGAVLWHANPNCNGGGSRTGAFDNGRLYLRNPGDTNAVLDATNGATVGTFAADRIPAFDGDVGFYVSHPGPGNGLVQAKDAAGMVSWSFRGDGDLITAPLVVNHYLYVGSTSGTLFAVDAASGTQLWSDASGAPFEDPDAVADTQPLPGMAAAEDLLIVSNSRQLVAYGQ